MMLVSYVPIFLMVSVNSSFCRIVDGVTYKAQIQERQMAEKAYDQAVSKGESAAQVSQE